jgi:hypothetical protein
MSNFIIHHINLLQQTPLQVLPLDPSRGLWSWLVPAQSSGASLPREIMVARCAHDPRVLQFLCQASPQLLIVCVCDNV